MFSTCTSDYLIESAEAESVTMEKEEAVQLQVKLNEREMALAASEAERMRLRSIIKEKDQYIADLEAEVSRHRESAQGLNTLKQARHKVWTQICDVVEKGWDQLLKYQELKEQVVSANHKLRQLDHKMENRVDTAKKILVALENFPD